MNSTTEAVNLTFAHLSQSMIIGLFASGFVLFILGLFIGRIIGGQSKYAAAARAAQAELQEYKQRVSEHFGKTADLVDQLTDSYKSVFEHLNHSAHELLSEADVKQHLQARKQKTVTLTYTADAQEKDTKSLDIQVTRPRKRSAEPLIDSVQAHSAANNLKSDFASIKSEIGQAFASSSKQQHSELTQLLTTSEKALQNWEEKGKGTLSEKWRAWPTLQSQLEGAVKNHAHNYSKKNQAHLNELSDQVHSVLAQITEIGEMQLQDLKQQLGETSNQLTDKIKTQFEHTQTQYADQLTALDSAGKNQWEALRTQAQAQIAHANTQFQLEAEQWVQQAQALFEQTRDDAQTALTELKASSKTDYNKTQQQFVKTVQQAEQTLADTLTQTKTHLQTQLQTIQSHCQTAISQIFPHTKKD